MINNMTFNGMTVLEDAMTLEREALIREIREILDLGIRCERYREYPALFRLYTQLREEVVEHESNI